MVKYRWQSVDYYDNTTVRAFEFQVVDGEKTAILGNREDVQVRDTTNQANILVI